MSSISKCHKEVDEHGIGKCSVPMWWGWGGQAGFCDEPAYGNPVREVGEWEGGRFIPKYVPALACPRHGGPESRVYRDGDAWCAVRPDFVDLQESPAGFGTTPEEARAALEEST